MKPFLISEKVYLNHISKQDENSNSIQILKYLKLKIYFIRIIYFQ